MNGWVGGGGGCVLTSEAGKEDGRGKGRGCRIIESISYKNRWWGYPTLTTTLHDTTETLSRFLQK